jgi:hypothetical protein
MSLFKEKSEKPNVVPGSQIPKQGQPVDLSKIKIEFTGSEVDQILKYLSTRPWAEVTNLMDMFRVKLASTKLNEVEIIKNKNQ